MIVIEILQNIPTNLDLQHLYTFLLESNETLHCYRVVLLLFAFLLDYVLYRTDILATQLGLEDSLLQV